MFRKNVASQNLAFCLVNATSGAALTGATVSGYRSIDGAAQAAVTGTITELANGQYNLALSQADTNGNNIGYFFTATNAIPTNITAVTTAADPTDTVRFGLTSLPNAAAEAAGGLYTRGTGAGQITQATNGQIDVDAKKINAVATTSVTTINANMGTTQPVNFTGTGASALAKSDMVDVAGAAVSTTSAQIGVNAVNIGGTAQTGRDIGASVLLSTGTGTGQLDFTSGVVKANATQFAGQTITAAAGVTLPSSVASPTNITAGTITTVTNLTNAPTSGDLTATMKTSVTTAATAATPTVTLAAAAVQAIWDALTSALTTVGSIGKLLVTDIDATISSRSTLTGTAQTGDCYARLGAPVGASISADIAEVEAETDDIAAVKAKTDNLPASPAAVGSAMTLTSGERSSIGQAVWDALTSALTTVGSIGKLIVTNLDAAISSRGTFSGGAVSSVTGNVTGSVGSLATQAKTDVENAVWDATASSHNTALTLGNKLNSAASTGDPLLNAVPGAYASGTAGYVLGTNLNATVSSRAATGAAMTLTSGERNSVADALLDRTDAIETGLTVRQAHRLESSAAAGKLAGAGTATVTIRNAVQDSKARITATVSNGNRTAITTDVS